MGALNHCTDHLASTRPSQLQSILFFYEHSTTDGSFTAHAPRARKGAKRNAPPMSPSGLAALTGPPSSHLPLAASGSSAGQMEQPLELGTHPRWELRRFCFPFPGRLSSHQSGRAHALFTSPTPHSLSEVVWSRGRNQQTAFHHASPACSPYALTPESASSFIK